MKKVINLNPWLVLFIFLIPASLSNSPFGNTLTGFTIAFFTFYFYSLAHALFKKLQNGHDLNIQLFNLNLVFFVILSIIDRTFFSGYVGNSTAQYSFGWSAALLVPIRFLAGFTIFYCMYWIAKCIVTIRLGRLVPFHSFASTFFLMWMFPISMFWILPSVRRILEEDVELSRKS